MKFYSDVTKTLYDTMEACEAAEAAHRKAEEEKKNGYKMAVAELDELLEMFNEQKKIHQESYNALTKTANTLHHKYVEYQRKYGQLPDNHYPNYILTKLI